MLNSLSLALLVLSATPPALPAAPAPPVQVGLDAEFSLDNSISAQAIEQGLRIAMAEINAQGGVLGGRKLELVTRDNGSIPARGVKNIREFAQMPDLVAVFGGRFSPVLLEELPTVKETGLLLMAPWSSADPITQNALTPNPVFRLSLKDSLAVPKMLQFAAQRGLKKVGLLLTNTGWGRSNKAAADGYAKTHKTPEIVHTAWYNFKDTTLVDKYESLLKAGAAAVILVANDDEAATLVREIAALPPAQRVPILSHWGVAGGRFVEQAGPALSQVDFTIIQTFSFFNAKPDALKRFFASGKAFGLEKPIDVRAAVGVAHAYDLVHLLAVAIDQAGTTDRAKVRDALEHLPRHQGLIRTYEHPFSPSNHDALGPEQLLMTRYREDGALVPLP